MEEQEKQRSSKYKTFYEDKILWDYNETCNGVDKHSWKILNSQRGIVGFTYSIRWCPICGAIGNWGGFGVEHLESITLPEQSSFNFDEYNLELNKEKRIKELQKEFIETVCKEYNCGSQHCDGSEEWIEGCKLYQEFLAEKFK